jgi:hypothetical protein
MLPGDYAHALVLFNTFLYLVAMICQSSGAVDIFSAQVAEDGFCISNQDKSVNVQSHMLCFYGDSLASLVLLFLTWKSTNKRLAPVRANIPGIFFHGVAHGYIGYKGVSASEGLFFVSKPMSERALDFAVLGTFWIALLYAALPKLSWRFVVPFAALNTVLLQLVPGRFGFTYVQTVLFSIIISLISFVPINVHLC